MPRIITFKIVKNVGGFIGFNFRFRISSDVGTMVSDGTCRTNRRK